MRGSNKPIASYQRLAKAKRVAAILNKAFNANGRINYQALQHPYGFTWAVIAQEKLPNGSQRWHYCAHCDGIRQLAKQHNLPL
jgi:hypothetical protein